MRILRDLALATRIGRRNPVFTLSVVCTLAIGIGATTAMFAIVNDVLLQPLPYFEPDRLVSIQAKAAQSSAFSVPDFLDLQASATAYLSMATWEKSSAVLSGAPEPEEASTLDVSPSFFGTVGVRPMLGRVFLPTDGVGSALVLSERLWISRYGKDPAIVGRTILVDSKPVTVIGVIPALLDQYLDAQLFRLLDLHGGHASVRAYHTQPVIGRLRAGVTIATAEAETRTIGSRLAATYAEDRGQTFTVRSYAAFLASGSRVQLLALLGAVLLVLLVACGNVGSLMLTRLATRRAELATQAALGATTRDLLQQLMLECLLLSVSGGLLGTTIALLVIRSVRMQAVRILPRAAEIHLDGFALLFAFCVSVGAGVVIGIISAVETSGSDLSHRLTTASRASGSRFTARVRDLVVVVQFVMSTVLLFAAFALINSFRTLRQVDPGFDPKGVFAAYVTLPDKQYAAHSQHLFWSDVLAQVRALPNVKAASAVSRLPFGGGANGMASYLAPGTSISASPAFAEYDVVEDHYFETMRVPVIAGTSLDTPEARGAEAVVVVSHSLAAATFHFSTAIGRTLTFPDFGGFNARIIGVVGNVRTRGLSSGPLDVVYFPASQLFGFEGHAALVARVTGDPLTISAAVRRIVTQSNPLLALDRPRLMEDAVGESTARLRFESTALGWFAVTAVLLAGIGLFGLLSYGVTIRSRELAIRFALGAQGHQLFSLILRRGAILIAIGGGVALLLVPIVITLVQRTFGIREKMIGPLIVTSAILTIIGIAACVVPAFQAVRLGSSWSDRPE